jgi:Fur family peroxide stress response transcriptional regulator
LQQAVRVDEAEVQRRVEAFKAAVKDAGIKLTHQRLEIFREVAGSLDHPDAETVFDGIRTRLPTASLDTVYRTLWLLQDLGLVRTLGPRHGSVRFDANLRPHHHYVCMRCGLSRDLENVRIEGVRIPAAVKGFGSVLTTHLEVRGVCAACAKRKGDSRSRPRGRAGSGRT